MYITGQDKPKLRLYALTESRFFIKEADLDIEINRQGRGGKQMVIYQYGGEMVGNYIQK